MGDHIDLYEAFYRMENMVDIMYSGYQEKMEKDEYDKERAEDDAPSSSSSGYTSSSSSSHHSNEEINKILQV